MYILVLRWILTCFSTFYLPVSFRFCSARKDVTIVKNKYRIQAVGNVPFVFCVSTEFVSSSIMDSFYIYLWDFPTDANSLESSLLDVARSRRDILLVVLHPVLLSVKKEASFLRWCQGFRYEKF